MSLGVIVKVLSELELVGEDSEFAAKLEARHESHKEMKAKNPSMTTIAFRVEQYRPFF